MKKTTHEARLAQIKAMCPSGCKFIIIPGHVIFVAMIYGCSKHMVFLSFRDCTEPNSLSETCKSNRFEGLIPHGGVEILMFSDGFCASKFAVKFNSDLNGTIHITSNEKGIILDNEYGLEPTNDPIKFVLDRVIGGLVSVKPTIEAWSKSCRLRTFGLLLCMKLFGGELIRNSKFFVSNKSYDVRAAYTWRKVTDYRLVSSSIVEYFIYVVVSRSRKLARVYSPISSVAFLPRETDGLANFTQEYDDDGFPVHELFRTYFDFDHTQAITPEVINKARVHFGIQDANDYGVDADMFCTSIYDSILQLMIIDQAGKRVSGKAK